jgi:hypothetical protein
VDKTDFRNRYKFELMFEGQGATKVSENCDPAVSGTQIAGVYQTIIVGATGQHNLKLTICR